MTPNRSEEGSRVDLILSNILRRFLTADLVYAEVQSVQTHLELCIDGMVRLSPGEAQLVRRLVDIQRTPTGNLPSDYHDLVPPDPGATCPPGEHSYGWESDDATYCECGVQICGHVSVNAGDTYVCVRPPHEPNVGHMVALR